MEVYLTDPFANANRIVLLVNKATSSTTADSKHPPVNKWEALESTHERKEEQISSQSSVPRVAQAPLPVVPVAVSTETIENDAPDRAPAKVPEKKHRVTKGLASSIYAR